MYLVLFLTRERSHGRQVRSWVPMGDTSRMLIVCLGELAVDGMT
jgi:hypothetical protein